jgi:hypothetical protein
MRNRIQTQIKVLSNTLTGETKVWTNGHTNRQCEESYKARVLDKDIREVKVQRYKSNLQTDRTQVFMRGLYDTND